MLLAAAIFYSNTHAEGSKTIELKKGEKYRIELESNATTGYTWQYLDLPKDAPIKIIETDFTYPKGLPKNVCGAPGKQYWIIKARRKLTKADFAYLVLHYKRPWLKDEEPARTETYTFKVT